MKKEEIIIGKTLEEAIEILRNCKVRIMRDGDLITSDLCFDRYNLYIENNIVKEVKMF
jgi:hypothetical protein